MAKTQRNFIKGRMNKSLDERLIPNGEYVDALNVRLGSTEDSEVGSVENAKGNTRLTSLYVTDLDTSAETALSNAARTLGAYQDSANETLYWFVHDPSFTLGDTGKCDMIVSFNTRTSQVVYHITSIDDGTGVNTTLNFDPAYLITGINLVGDLLFFTDNLNPPRFININNDYSNPVISTTANPAFDEDVCWVFTAEEKTIDFANVVGFDRGTLLGYPSLNGLGTGVTPTTTQVPLPGVDPYTKEGSQFTKGFGIKGVNSATNLALTTFTMRNPTLSKFQSVNMQVINASNVNVSAGSRSISGTITGNDGTSGTFNGTLTSGGTDTSGYVDANGTRVMAETGGSFMLSDSTTSLQGMKLVGGVTYTIKF